VDEPRTFNALVAGSNPVALTIFFLIFSKKISGGC